MDFDNLGLPEEREPQHGRASRLGAMMLACGVALLSGFLGCRRAPAAPRIATSDRVARPPAPPADSGYSFRPEEKEAVEAFLRANRDLRMATDDDRRPSESDDLGKLYAVYHPYFLRGDVNDDGILDFVLGFVKRDSDRDSPWFSVVAFPGKEGAGFGPGSFIERDVSLADGDLSVDRDSIVITPDLDEDENTRRYRWDPLKRSYVFVSDDAPGDEGVPSAQT
ncbi:MAG TPA: hypothetical protein VK392_06265 [Thermoanaerobaculia bacterium]|nr:hypothetical protein [Thermoanaerobaculia bacterium]